MPPKLIVEQKITAFANQYRIYETDPDGEKIGLLAFAQQKRLAFKEKVIFYSDETKSREVFSFRAEKIMDVHGRFLVEDTNGNLLGAFKKDFKKSLLSSTWHLIKNDKPTITINESNQIIAVFRRVAGLIPIVGDVAEIIAALFKYHFVFTDASGGEKIGKYQKITLLRDHYKLFMEDESYKKQDWRVLASLAVALDALQSR
ncbi:hypothetical protein KY385_00540 [Candidatus Parcubacteria bacterium]|nr:hypothetical protein [Candidatus Parcubacteria bacterium]